MTSRLAFQLDLAECQLEERVLPYAGPGLYASQFIPSSGSTPSFVVSGFSLTSNGPGGGAPSAPGPQFFYLPLGISSIANGGVRLGGNASVFLPPAIVSSVAGASIGTVPGSGGGAATGTTVGYGGAISSGYNTSLNSANNYGMSATAVGSIAAHVAGANDQLTEAEAAGASTTTPAQSQDETADPNAPPTAMPQGPFSAGNRLLGKSLGDTNGLLIGPGMSGSPSSLAPRP